MSNFLLNVVLTCCGFKILEKSMVNLQCPECNEKNRGQTIKLKKIVIKGSYQHEAWICVCVVF